ncbi:MAG: addiction module protein [Thioalkalivibrio sp.]|nr:addiction module protein [Thioalkalivibrio sp.]
MNPSRITDGWRLRGLRPLRRTRPEAASLPEDSAQLRGGAISKVSKDELLHLSIDEKIQLIDDLWESVAADPEGFVLSEAQRKEVRGRLEEHRADPGSAIPWEQVRRVIV